VNSGGCKISPTLFSLYMNDLVHEINSLNCGITFNEDMISILLYADDVLLAPDADSLQLNMLDVLDAWLHRWKLENES